MSSKGKDKQIQFMNLFSIRSEFMDIIRVRKNMMAAEDNQNFYVNEYRNRISSFLRKAIGRKLINKTRSM